MKKIISVLLSVMMLSAVAAMAEDVQVEPIIGTITEMREDGSFIVDTMDGTQVHVLTNEDTKDEVDWAIGEGDVVVVSYDGRMTRSMPGQINAITIRSDSIEGYVEEVDAENNRLLINSHAVGQVWVTLPEDVKAEDYTDKAVRVYTNGVMALSLPPQAFALSISEVFAENGRIKEIGDEYFIMDWGTSDLRVNFDSHTKVVDSFDTGDGVQVYYNGMMTRSLPGQIYAMVVVKVPLQD